MTAVPDDETHESLLSSRLLFRITATIGVLAALTAVITVLGKRMGDTIALGGHTTSTTIHRIILGQDRLNLPANLIRFEAQRRDGQAETVNIYLAWPDLDGYRTENAQLFSDPARGDALIFADFSQSVMSREMSGRLEPIYSKLFEGAAAPGPAGLTIHSLSARSGFGDEKLLTGTLADGGIYAVRCILPQQPAVASAGDCQRDVQVGKDLTMLYRFSSRLLPQWQEIERKLVIFASAHISD